MADMRLSNEDVFVELRALDMMLYRMQALLVISTNLTPDQIKVVDDVVLSAVDLMVQMKGGDANERMDIIDKVRDRVADKMHLMSKAVRLP